MAITVGLSLTGCAGSGTAAEPSPTSPSATPPVLPADAPEQRFALGCEQLLSASEATAMFGPGVSVRKDTTAIESLAGPRGNAVRQLGGLVCLWTDGTSRTAATESVAPGAWVTIRPDAEQEWTKYAAAYGEEALALRCGTEAPPVTCLAEYGTHGYWIEIRIRGAIVADGETTVAAVTPAVERIRSAVTALPAPSSAWVAPSGTQRIPSDCEEFMPIEAVRSVLGQSEPIVYSRGDGWSLPGTIQTDPNHAACFVGTTESDDILVGTEWLAGGAWAFEREVRPRLEDGTAKAVTVAGLGQGDAALRCDDAAGTCALDLRVGGNWVRSTVFMTVDGPTFSAENRQTAEEHLPELAAVIVAALAG